jgi:hypothetical protein
VLPINVRAGYEQRFEHICSQKLKC